MPCHVPAHTALNIMPGTSLFSQQHTVASKARCTQAVLLPLRPVASHQQAAGTPQGPPSHAERHTELRRHACGSKRSFCSPSACVPCENRPGHSRLGRRAPGRSQPVLPVSTRFPHPGRAALGARTSSHLPHASCHPAAVAGPTVLLYGVLVCAPSPAYRTRRSPCHHTFPPPLRAPP